LVPRLSARFETLRGKNEKALVLFVTAGDPSLDQVPEILHALQDSGADVIELGIPFTDPIADGPTIQASSQRALDRGVKPRDVLNMLKDVELEIPLVLMGYLNPMLRMGYDNFATTCLERRASATIVCDVTPEEAGEWLAVSRNHGLDTIFLAAPTSTQTRLEMVARHSTGFVYALSRTGVTGAASQAGDEVERLVGDLRKLTKTPICVGFGISQPDHVRRVCQVADGAVVGSYLVDLLAKDWQGGAGKAKISDTVQALKDATR
jgi:tryptophan synthase alpha chain